MLESTEQIIEVVDSKIGLQGWVIIDTIRDGLCFGGLRMHPSVTLPVVKELAQSMSYKLAGHGLPVGGAKGGIKGDPREPGFENKIRRFGELLSHELRTRLILGKDVGATDELMKALYDGAGIKQLHIIQERARQEKSTSTVPDFMNQLTGYISRMTAFGVVTAAQAAVEDHLEGKRVLIQGAGVVGGGVAHRMASLGATIVGISDHRYSIYRATGFRPEELENGLERGDIQVERFGKEIETSSPDALLGKDADVLVLAALSNTVTEKLSHLIRARIIIEGANFALLPDARSALHTRGIPVVPDVIASSSSAALVTMQMRSRNSIPDSEVWDPILASIRSNTRKVMASIRTMEPRDAFVQQVLPEIRRYRPK